MDFHTLALELERQMHLYHMLSLAALRKVQDTPHYKKVKGEVHFVPGKDLEGDEVEKRRLNDMFRVNRIAANILSWDPESKDITDPIFKQGIFPTFKDDNSDNIYTQLHEMVKNEQFENLCQQPTIKRIDIF